MPPPPRRPSASTPPSRWVLGTVLALAYAAGLAGLVLHTTDRPPTTPASARPTSGLPAPSVSSPPAARLSLPEKPEVLILGDSYTEGWGAEPVTEGFAHQLDDLLDWRVVVDGVGSTGYVDRGLRNQGTYRERLARVQPRPFDLVVLQGGSNDEGTPVAELSAAVDQTVAAAHDRFPTAEVVLMGPVAPYGSATEERATVNAVLLRVARENELPYVNPIYEKWFVPADRTTDVNLAKGHPNNKGYAKIARRFAEDIEVLSQPVVGS